jgi:hypothetical protein
MQLIINEFFGSPRTDLEKCGHFAATFSLLRIVKITIPQEPDEQKHAGELTRKNGNFVFFLDSRGPEGESLEFSLVAMNWTEAKRQCEILLYLTRKDFKISSAPLPPKFAHLENLEFGFAFDPNYGPETIDLLINGLAYPVALLADESYTKGKKQAAKLPDGILCESIVASDFPVTVDSKPLHVLCVLKLRNTGEITQATVYAGTPEWIANISKTV